MLNDARGFRRIIIACGKTDLRRGIDGLAAIVQEQFHLDPGEKDVLFLFCGTKMDRIKGLVYEGDGYLLLYKRLSAGRFQWPRKGWKRLPDEIYRKLEYHPATKEVVEHHVAVYAAKKEDKIVRTPHPAELLVHSVATPSLVAAIMTAKYTNALPLNRIAQEMARYDVKLPVPTLANWTIRCAERYLYPVSERMKDELRTLPVMQADETVCKVSKDARPANAESRMFVYRSGEFEQERIIILYDYQKTRKTAHIASFLGSFSGVLVSDAYSGYHSLDRTSEKMNCWAHARRSFADALKVLKKGGYSKKTIRNSVAYQALERISSLYALEDQWKELSPEERYSRRQEHSKPLVEAYFAWVKLLTRAASSLRTPERVCNTVSIRRSI